MLGLCRLDAKQRAGSLSAGTSQELYVDHFSITWTTRYHTAGAPLLLLVTSRRVVLGDEARLRPMWEVPLERIARVELQTDHVMLWTWEKFLNIGVGSNQSTHAYNIVVERSIMCNNAATLEACFQRLRAVSTQYDRTSMLGYATPHGE